MAKFMPGDPFTGLITPETDPARIEELRIKAGFYDPWYVQYVTGLGMQFKEILDIVIRLKCLLLI